MSPAWVEEVRRGLEGRLEAWEYARRVREVLGETQIFLYGSVARGNFNGESDIDLLVASPNLPKEPLERLALLQGMNAGWVEARGLTPEEFSRLKVKSALWWLEGAVEL